MSDKQTHFGYQTIQQSDKSARVAEVFDSVAKKYDLMNDLMSGGMHRLWKLFTLNLANPRLGQKVLDIAAGTGDLAKSWAKKVGKTGEVWLTDINHSMLEVGRDRLLDEGLILPLALADAEKLPFPDNYFDLVSVGFGLRNMTNKDAALQEMYRVLKRGGRLIILEFSQIWQPLSSIYDLYSFKALPLLGKIIADDSSSYQYLAESIRVHPNQEKLKEMLIAAGFVHVDYHNLSAGAVAVHSGYKI